MSTSDRLLAILDLFTLDRPDWSVEEAAAVLGVAVSSAYRYFNSLSRTGLLTGLGGGRYGLGPTVIRYDRQLRLTDPLVLAADAELDRLARLLPGRSVAFLCRLFGDQVMCVAQVAIDDPPFALGYERGRPMPLFAGSASRVILSHLDSRRLRSLYRREPASFAAAGLGDEWRHVRTALRIRREAGGCISSGEVDAGMRGVSAAVVAPGVLGSVTIAGPRAALTDAAARRLLSEVVDAARAVERGLGRIAERSR